jgi:hypothetical protein
MGRPVHRFEVHHREVAGGRVEMSLVRRLDERGHELHRLLRGGRQSQAVVLAARSFGTRDIAALSSYQATLERAAEHGNRGTLGCFVDSVALADGRVRLELYERWLDGDKLRCEQLAQRVFDAQDDEALVSSSEFAAELREWSERRNEQRDAAVLQSSYTDARRAEDNAERRRAAHELAAILARAGE